MFGKSGLPQKFYKMKVYASRNYTKDALIHVMHIVPKRFHCYFYCTHKGVSGLPGINQGLILQKLLVSCECFAACFVIISI